MKKMGVVQKKSSAAGFGGPAAGSKGLRSGEQTTLYVQLPMFSPARFRRDIALSG